MQGEEKRASQPHNIYNYEQSHVRLRFQTKLKKGDINMFEEILKENRYGYARVSSKSQEENSSLETQKQELLKHGVPEENIRIEVGSAADSIIDRPVLTNLLENELKKDSLLVVTKLDRCSQNTLEFLKLQDSLFKRDITFVALDLPNSSDLAMNRLISTTLSAIAEFEYNRRRERQRE